MVYITKIDKNANKELNRKNIISWLFILLIGLVMAILGVVSSLYRLMDSIWCSLLISFGGVMILFSLIIIILIFKISKNQDESKIELSYDFRKKYFLLDRLKDGKIIENEKIDYKDIFRIKETKNYIYIYRTSKTVIPFYKSNCKLEDLELIKNYFKNND